MFAVECSNENSHYNTDGNDDGDEAIRTFCGHIVLVLDKTVTLKC